MKFGANLPRNQVPEWSSDYINYKGLKKLIKSAAAQEQAASDTDLAGWWPAPTARRPRSLLLTIIPCRVLLLP